MNAHNTKYGFESPVVDKGTIEIKRGIVISRATTCCCLSNMHGTANYDLKKSLAGY